jgi:site-specific DNA-methyltransferase (adenine-specific)
MTSRHNYLVNKIIHQDCLAGMKALDVESIDICVTSPPYNLDIKYGAYEDNQPREAYLAWLSDIFGQIARVLKPEGHFFLNMGYSNVDPWVGMDVANVARKHMILQNNFTWVKSIAIDDVQLGHYKPINSQRFANPTWEHLFHFTKTGNVPCQKTAIGVPYADKGNLDKSSRWRGKLIKKMGFENKRAFDASASPAEKQELEDALARKLAKAKPVEDLHCPGNVWYIPYETIADRGAQRGTHPATFPVELVRRAIKFSGVSGTLLDPFIGTGTSAVAAQAEGLSYLGFDVDDQYIAFAESRLTSGERQSSESGLDRTQE